MDGVFVWGEPLFDKLREQLGRPQRKARGEPAPLFGYARRVITVVRDPGPKGVTINPAQLNLITASIYQLVADLDVYIEYALGR